MKALDLARELVAIPSVTGSEGAIARRLEAILSGIGCRTRLYEAAPGRPNVYAELGAQPGAAPGVLFHGHVDTVAAHGMADPFSARVEGGRLYGRGSVDQKGGLAAAIAAIAAIAESGATLAKPVAVVCVIDEESEHRGSMALKEMGVRAEFGVITEPTGLRLGVGCKGTAPILVKVKGRAAHGCRPWLGANAIVAGMDMAKLLLSMPPKTAAVPGIGEARGSLNLGKVEGGRAYNIVADACELWFDRRLVPGETQMSALAEVRAALDAYLTGEAHGPAGGPPGSPARAPAGIDAVAEIARPDWNWDPIKLRGLLPALTDVSDPVVAAFEAAHASVAGSAPERFFTDGYQEMDFLVNDLGINAIQYGPGDSSLCHTDGEFLDIGQLEAAAEIYEAFARARCAAGSPGGGAAPGKRHGGGDGA